MSTKLCILLLLIIPFVECGTVVGNPGEAPKVEKPTDQYHDEVCTTPFKMFNFRCKNNSNIKSGDANGLFIIGIPVFLSLLLCTLCIKRRRSTRNRRKGYDLVEMIDSEFDITDGELEEFNVDIDAI